MKQTLEKHFMDVTGESKAPIEMPIRELFSSFKCDSVGCMEQCNSCWTKFPITDEEFQSMELKPEYKEVMMNFICLVVDYDGRGELYTVEKDCYGRILKKIY